MPIRDYSRRLFCNIEWCGLRRKPSCLYSSMDNGLFTLFMPTKYHHFACFRLSTLLYVLFLCLHARTQKVLSEGGGGPTLFFLMRGELVGGGGGGQIKIPLYEGCSNMNASSFITFFTYMLRQNVIPFWKELFVAFKMVPNIKKHSLYFSSYRPFYKGHPCILKFF